ncbi:MAG: hypothetical protein Q9212_006369, partial [Teloschistes hypoglaucus]
MDNKPLVEPEASHSQPPPVPPPLIIKADELDSTGTDVSTPIPDISTPITPALQAPPSHHPQSGLGPPLSSSPRAAPPRPILRREGSTPAPPPQPPPPTPQQQHPTDSLSLLQLRRLVTDLPKLEPQAYAYEHADTRSFPDEVEEWFSYSEDERSMLLKTKQAFEKRWRKINGQTGTNWIDSKEKERETFVHGIVEDIQHRRKTVKGVRCLAYLAMGCWGETAGLVNETIQDSEVDGAEQDQGRTSPTSLHSSSASQIEWIRKGCELLAVCGALQSVFDLIRMICESEQESYQPGGIMTLLPEEEAEGDIVLVHVMDHALTCLYLAVEVARCGPPEAKSTIRKAIGALEPTLLHYLTKVIARTRWQESPLIPFTRILLLYWKVVLVMFGNSDDLKYSKKALRIASDLSKDEGDDKEGFITASPLDYHLFRQEITSKYPAYNPPQPLVPIELENNSILPPLPNHPSRRTSQENLIMPNGPNAKDTPGSIFNQPVHIATPAPSPPPSPAGPGGKGGKKQNYQTNQNFPFLYPPPDAATNIIGGKGNTELQDQLLGKRWEGSDVPASILEAGSLFASRMRMSRSIRQLWDVRERFIRHERGWDEVPNHSASSSSSGSMIEEDESDRGEEAVAEPNSQQRSAIKEPEADTYDMDVLRRLDAIESFYRDALPHLQSVVLVLWKVVFTNVSILVAQANGTNGLRVPNAITFPEDDPSHSPVKRKMNINPPGQKATAGGNATEIEEESDPVLEELDNIRQREIRSKAVTSVLLMLLKWFKLSHILKYEYLTQLLLDANYVPLILKLFAHQDVDRAVDQKNDREDLNFFHFCHLNSNHPPSPMHQVPSPSPSSPDSAAPPPIPTHRRSRSTPSSSPPSPPQKPSVDELGYPTAPLPSSPLTTYAPRFFHTTTNTLRLLQKIIGKNHAHRALLLVQYKSSTILRKLLKIPNPTIRLYTLKLFKQQVPFCGRKWRQGNMRVITACWLHLGMRGLRDEWLAGGDIDAVVEESVPVEEGWRGLCHWWHLRKYREEVEGTALGGGKSKRAESGEDEEGEEESEVGDKRDGREDESDFFKRELERMGWGG